MNEASLWGRRTGGALLPSWGCLLCCAQASSQACIPNVSFSWTCQLPRSNPNSTVSSKASCQEQLFSEKSRSPAHVACPLTCLVSLPHFVLGQRAVQARGRNQSQRIWFPFCSATRWVDYVSSMNFNFLTLIFKNII